MAKDTPRKKVAATPQKKDNAKKSEPVAAKTKPAEQKKNDEPKLKEKKNNKRKLEETEETKESVEAVEEKTEEPAQKKKKSAPTTTSDEKSTLVAQYVRVKSNVLMTTLTKTLKLDVASLDAKDANATISLNSSKQRNKLLQSERVVRVGNSDVVFSAPSSETVDRHGLLVSNISVKVTDDILKACFKEIAPVKKIIYLKSTPLAKTAIILFKKQVGDDALEYNGAPIEERNIYVRFLTEEDKRVYVRQVAKDVTNDELKKYMEEIGSVDFVALITDQQNKAPNMFAVQFKEYEHVAEALQFSGADIHGRACAISQQEATSEAKQAAKKQ